ncbi:MAG: hypothetical protein KF862_19390 [Chitinophagaceae bacterium]|nr:hypothetical protein [Chitinophagaceae bacterium]
MRKAFSTIMHAVLYLIFFAAQLLSVNPDLPGRQNTVLVFSVKQFSKSPILIVDKDGDNKFTDDDEAGIRINKRFQVPKFILHIPEPSSLLSVVPPVKKKLYSYNAHFVSSCDHPLAVLRGPPVL